VISLNGLDAVWGINTDFDQVKVTHDMISTPSTHSINKVL